MSGLHVPALQAVSASRHHQNEALPRSIHGFAAGVLVVAICIAAIIGSFAPFAHAAFGDTFGLADVNKPGAPIAPAFPGTSAFWAGGCETADAPIGPTGGLGTRPATVWVPLFDDPTNSSDSKAVTAPTTPDQCIDWGRLLVGDARLWHQDQGPAWRLAPVTQAGAHPDAGATLWFRRAAADALPYFSNSPDGSVDNIYTDLPAGFSGNPAALPKCTAEQFAFKPIRCPPRTQVGVIHLYLTGVPFDAGTNYGFSNEEILPVYNLEPRHGNAAEFGFADASDADAASVRIVAKARTRGDFGITAFAAQIPAALPLLASAITIWGMPWAASHDLWRPPQGWTSLTPGLQGLDPLENGMGEIPAYGLPTAKRVGYDPSWGPIKPFLSNSAECAGQELSTRLSTDSFEHPGAFAEGLPDLTDLDWKSYLSPAPPITGCEKVPFDPSATFTPSSTAADSASGLSAEITIPQNDEPPAAVASNPSDEDGAPAHWKSDAGLSTSHLDKTVVTLPEGMSLNPSAATGLLGCSDEQMGVRQVGNPYLFNDVEPSCREASKIGTIEATTPVLDGSPNLTGDVYVGAPKSTDPQSGEMLRVFLVLRNEERGLLAKVHGTSTADPATGQLTATFDKNPRVPVESIKVSFKGGPRGLFGMPQRCGDKATASLFSPWSAAHGAGGPVRSLSDRFAVGGDCSFGFAPKLTAGMDKRQAAGSGTFSFQFSRSDGEQWFKALSAKLPPGLLASVKNVPLCTNAQATANTCPATSRIGSVDAGAGSGSPFFLERKGDAYLTEGYKGAPYGLAVSVPVEAGPFRGEFALTPIVVRQALQVNRDTAEVTAVSDPVPHIWHGIPLRVRQVTVKVDRTGFIRNPTDCSPKQITATIKSTEATAATPTAPFHVSGCQELRFKPKLTIRLTGAKQTRTGGHPGVRALLTQPRGQANIRSATTKLPLSLALDTKRAQSTELCEFEASKTADCPRSSIIGRTRAVSPLLKRPLTGPVYFAKNVRINDRGNAIRTLPSLVLALRGEVALNVRASSNSKGGKLITIFPKVPDAPVTRFALNLDGGPKGILQVTKSPTGQSIDICGAQTANVTFKAHNRDRRGFDLRLKTPCSEKKHSGR